MTAPREKIVASFNIHKGLPFKARLLYKSPRGVNINVSTWVGKLMVRPDVDSPTVLHTFSTLDLNMVLGNGTIEFSMTPAQTLALAWEEGVGHLVIGPTSDESSAIAFFGFRAQFSTTSVP